MSSTKRTLGRLKGTELSYGREKQMLLELFEYIVQNRARSDRLLSDIRLAYTARSTTLVENVVY